MKTEQTLKQAMIILARTQQQMAREDIETLKTTGHSRHYAFPYHAEGEAMDREINIQTARVTDLYQRIA